jgi:muramidase (phage lysozyme)
MKSRNFSLMMGLWISFAWACSNNSSNIQGVNEDSDILGKNAVGQIRYICATDVVPRNEKLDGLDEKESELLQFGTPITLMSGQKQGSGELSGHTYVQSKLKNGKVVWVSASFLKTAACKGSSREYGKINDSILHFTGDAPGILAMLDTIAYAEFRGAPEATSESAYKTIFDFRKFTDFSRHPRLLISGASDAAGRYQFLSTTWDDSQRYLSQNKISEISWLKGRMPDFSPSSQDKMAIFKIWWRYSYIPLRTIRSGDNTTLNQVTKRLSLEWASLPGSPYGQGTLDWSTFTSYYWSRYHLYNRSK